MIPIQVKIALFVALLLVGVGIYAYHNHVVRQNAAYELQIESQKQELAAWETYKVNMDAELQAERKRSSELSAKYAKAREEKERLDKLFSEHDTNDLLQKKPDLVISRFNAGTARVLADFEQAVNGPPAPAPAVRGSTGN